MRAIQTLPPGYVEAGSIQLKQNRRLSIILNVLGIPWCILCAAFFFIMAGLLGALDNGSGSSGKITMPAIIMLVALAILAMTIFVVVVLHELVHGLFFWLFIRSRPQLGFNILYAYAAAPGWYILRPQFLIVDLAPLVLISLAGLLILPFTTPPASLVLIVALILNAGGAISDLYVFIRLLFVPRHVLIEDHGDGVRWFIPTR